MSKIETVPRLNYLVNEMYFLPILEVASSTRHSALQIEIELGCVCAYYYQVENTLAPIPR